MRLWREVRFTMLRLDPTPLIRLTNIFPADHVYAKCEFTAPSGCFKIRGALHLIERLVNTGTVRRLIVPSMGNTALGAATGAQAFGFSMTGVVPRAISKDKRDKLTAMGVDLIQIEGGGSDLLRLATQIADETGAYFVHPHLDSAWTDGYREIAAEILRGLPECRTLVFPVGGGGLLLGLLAHMKEHPAPIKLIGCEPYNYPKYAKHDHSRTTTIADGLRIEKPHDVVRNAVDEAGIEIALVSEDDIRRTMKELYEKQALVVEPSGAIGLAYIRRRIEHLEAPICVVPTGGNIALEDFHGLIAI